MSPHEEIEMLPDLSSYRINVSQIPKTKLLVVIRNNIEYTEAFSQMKNHWAHINIQIKPYCCAPGICMK